MAVGAGEGKELGEGTGAPMVGVKNALEEGGGGPQEGDGVLRKQGARPRQGRGGRNTREGRVASYVHAEGSRGALAEVQSETDFVARNEDFQEFARQVAIHVTAMNPQHVSFEEIPDEDVTNERHILEERAK